MGKVLIISYYWPPSGGGGVQRWLKFSKYLTQFGWEPVIFTPENPDFDIKDYSLGKDISDYVEVLKFPIWEPYSVFNKLTGGKQKAHIKQGQVLEKGKKSFFQQMVIWLRGNFFIPDPRVFWVKPSVRFLSEIIESNQIRAVITTGPPHSMHLIGLRLKKKTGLPWIADFRDPWSDWDILKKLKVSSPALWLHRKLEKKVLLSANKVVTVSNTWANQLGSVVNRKVEVVTNGFDEDDFSSDDVDYAGGCFRISHIGMINELRNPVNFWKAIKELCSENKQFAEAVAINFTGILSEALIQVLSQDELLAEKVRLQGYVPHNEVMKLYQDSSVLLLIQNQSDNAKGHIPGKFFEYLASGRPLLVLGPKESDLVAILQETQAGYVCEPEDIQQIKTAIIDLFEMWKRKGYDKSKAIEQYSRKALAKKYAAILDQAVKQA
jgi:glycosyltransferase involved in cell wall biosynthesis